MLTVKERFTVYVDAPLRLWVKLLLGRLGLSWRGYRTLYHARRNSRARAAKARLSAEDVAAFARDQAKHVDTARRRAGLRITPENIGAPNIAGQMQTKCALLVAEALACDDTIRTIVNVGARVDVASCYLAEVWPDRRFVSLDFQENLAAQNAVLPQRDNWSFKSGYALGLMERGDIREDLIFMTSTAVVMTSPEFDTFLALAATAFRYVAINEVFYPPDTILGPLIQKIN